MCGQNLQIYLKIVTTLPLKILFLCQFYVVKRPPELYKSTTQIFTRVFGAYMVDGF